jgi:hypothetical protein
MPRVMRSRASVLVLFGIFQLACTDTSASPNPGVGTDGGGDDAASGQVPDGGSDATTDAASDGSDGAADDAGDAAGNGVFGTFGAACTLASSCDGGLCLFPVDGGCGAQGICFYNAPPQGVAQCAHATGMCACDGTGTYQLDCEAPGYAEAPVPSPTSFVCPVDAGTDAAADGGTDAAADGG